MLQRYERNLKNLLTQEEYLALCTHFKVSLEKDALLQVNHYLDTRTYELDDLDHTLCVREKNHSSWEFILKENHPLGFGMFETHHTPFQPTELYQLLYKQGVPLGNIYKRLKQLKLLEIASLVTHQGKQEVFRISINSEYGKFILDKVSYFDQTDFELKFEINPTIDNEGVDYFYDFLGKHSIKKSKGLSKRANFFKLRRAWAED